MDVGGVVVVSVWVGRCHVWVGVCVCTCVCVCACICVYVCVCVCVFEVLFNHLHVYCFFFENACIYI